MADPKADLPEGTDKIINGAMETNSSATGSSADLSADELSATTDTGTTDGAAQDAGGTAGAGTGAAAGSGGSLAERFRGGSGKLSAQAADKARGLVGQGLERSAEALANVGRLVGETAEGLDERLGEDYGNYARRAAGAIENAASNLAAKDPDELVDDTREFIRKSPGVALAGAAIAGFAIARLIKSGLSSEEGDEGEGGNRKRS
ncbi:MAG TPA: hypothetical protein VD768_03655 [Sphingomicrobium sp.]|nr:hypothetical protein [Sphingomicrobium sp.]